MDYETETETSQATFRSSTKIGRKGDPRMHRAVGARIANPKLHLFEALKIGGFEYPGDDDPNFMDSEFVTLGQRKNQLCRRVRIALRQCKEKNSYSEKKVCEANKICRCKPFTYPLNKRLQLVPEIESIAPSRLERGTQKEEVLNNLLVDPCVSDRTLDATPCIMNSEKAEVRQLLDCQPFEDYFEARLLSETPMANVSSDRSSNLAIESLKQTATSLGITLDQLALSLANWSDPLFKVNLTSQSRHDLATALYQRESHQLLRKAMLFAGYPPQTVRNDESPNFLQVALTNWKLEGQKLRDIISKSREKGRMPILHRPIGYTPHVDFIVDNRVECYFGTELYQEFTLENAHEETKMSVGRPFNDDPNVYEKNDMGFDCDEWNFPSDFDSHEFLLSFLSSTDPIPNQAIIPNDISSRCIDAKINGTCSPKAV